MKIGFSNGAFYQLFPTLDARFSEFIINKCKVGKANVLELNCFHEWCLDDLLKRNDRLFDGFEYLSMHSPDLFGNKREVENILSKIAELVQKYSLKNLVVHPYGVKDWNILERFFAKIPISIENMDEQKTSFRTVKEMVDLLAVYPFKMTLDLQHCYVNDNSMKLAEDFQDALKDKIAQYHISGYDSQVLHYSMYKYDQKVIAENLRFTNVPIIIESTFQEFEDAEKEIEYIRLYLS